MSGDSVGDDWADDDFVPPPEDPAVADSPSSDELKSEDDRQVATSTQERDSAGPVVNPLVSPIFHRPPDSSVCRPPMSKVPKMDTNDVECEEEEIRKLVQPKSSSIQRRFPGPAGILPRIHQALDSQPRLASILSKHNGQAVATERLPTASALSRSSSSTGKEELISCNAAWHKMIEDRQSLCGAADDPQKLLDRFNVRWIKKRMKGSSEIKHSPMLVAVVQTLDLKGDDPTCTLMDESGTIAGMIHGDVMAEHGSRIQPGSVIVLSNVAVLITLRKHYVNITRKNIAALYWNKTVGESGSCVQSKRVFQLTDEEVMNNFAQINREEALALKRAKELERQAVAEAAAEASGHHVPRMQTPQPPFKAPSMKSPPVQGQFPTPRMQTPQQPKFKPTSVSNPHSSVNSPASVIQQKPMNTVKASANASEAGTSSSSPVTTSESNELLDGLDEELLFGDF